MYRTKGNIRIRLTFTTVHHEKKDQKWNPAQIIITAIISPWALFYPTSERPCHYCSTSNQSTHPNPSWLKYTYSITRLSLSLQTNVLPMSICASTIYNFWPLSCLVGLPFPQILPRIQCFDSLLLTELDCGVWTAFSPSVNALHLYPSIYVTMKISLSLYQSTSIEMTKYAQMARTSFVSLTKKWLKMSSNFEVISYVTWSLSRCKIETLHSKNAGIFTLFNHWVEWVLLGSFIVY